MYENRGLRQHFDLIGKKQQETGENFTMRSFINFTLHQMLLGARGSVVG
jgi:hypothetical protein